MRSDGSIGDAPPPTRPAVDAGSVSEYLLRRGHVLAAFELYHDLLGTRGARADASRATATPSGSSEDDHPDARDAEARDALHAYFADPARFPPSALAEYADEATDVPALVARNQALESRARVAEYDLRVATEDLERVERERADALARLAAPRDPSRASRDASRPPAGVDGDPSRLFQDVLGTRRPPSSSPLPPPDDAERHALNVIVDEYLGERGYRAARLVLRDETAADAGGGVLDDWTAIPGGKPAGGDALRRLARRASALEAADPKRLEAAERALDAATARAEAAEMRIADAEARAASSETRLTDAEARAASAEERAETLARRVERAEATLEAKTAEWRRAVSAVSSDDWTAIPGGKPAGVGALHAFVAVEASAEESATIRALVHALPRVSPHVLIQHRIELLPLYGRAMCRCDRSELRRLATRLLSLVKRPGAEHVAATAETFAGVVSRVGDAAAMESILPAIDEEAHHAAPERRSAAAEILGAAARAAGASLRAGAMLDALARAALRRDPEPGTRTAAIRNVAALLVADVERNDADREPRRNDRAGHEPRRNDRAGSSERNDRAGSSSPSSSSSSSSPSDPSRCRRSRAESLDAASRVETLVATLAADASDDVSELAVATLAPAACDWLASPASGVDEGPARSFLPAAVAAAEDALSSEDARSRRWRATTSLRLAAAALARCSPSFLLGAEGVATLRRIARAVPPGEDADAPRRAAADAWDAARRAAGESPRVQSTFAKTLEGFATEDARGRETAAPIFLVVGDAGALRARTRAFVARAFAKDAPNSEDDENDSNDSNDDVEDDLDDFDDSAWRARGCSIRGVAVGGFARRRHGRGERFGVGARRVASCRGGARFG